VNNQKPPKAKAKETPKFIEGVDYYFENGLMVLTEHFLRKRGYCCGSGCRHCPYPKEELPDHNK
jgi:hypothetical protein